MAVQRLPIVEFLEQSENGLVLDVRSPGEYGHAHFPGAVSLPLFTDEERKIVGTLYKQDSRQAAIRAGLDFFGPKMRPMVEQVQALLDKAAKGGKQNSQIFLYCWRGGMRSGAVAWLLDLYGFRVRVLSGGYKAFRHHVLQVLERPYSLQVLGGYTGSGKTEVLKELEKQGEQVIDLEELASHKGSAFGKHGMPPQPSQEMFEIRLAMALKKSGGGDESKSIWIEDESQRIGDLNLPSAFWKTLRQAPVVFLEIPFEERLEHIVREYCTCSKGKLIEGVQRIAKRLGPQHARTAISLLEEGNTKEAFRILLLYYDKRYLKGLQNRENLSALLTQIACKTVTTENAGLLTKYLAV